MLNEKIKQLKEELKYLEGRENELVEKILDKIKDFDSDYGNKKIVSQETIYQEIL